MSLHPSSPQAADFVGLSAPVGTLRCSASSMARKGRLRGEATQSTDRNRIAASGAQAHE